MVLRPDAIRQRLLKLEEVLARLQELGPLDPTSLRTNFRDAWSAERGLQLAAEAVFDIGNHILGAHFGVSARDYEDILQQLTDRGVIGAALHARLRGLGGFRNILVHGYLEIDADKVTGALAKAPADFSEFAKPDTDVDGIRHRLRMRALLALSGGVAFGA